MFRQPWSRGHTLQVFLGGGSPRDSEGSPIWICAIILLAGLMTLRFPLFASLAELARRCPYPGYEDKAMR
jgi:hypothetical protein